MIDTDEDGLGNARCPGCGSTGTMRSSTYWFMDGSLIERWTCSNCSEEVYGRMPRDTVWVSENGLWAVTETIPEAGCLFTLEAGGRRDPMRISVTDDGRTEVDEGKGVPYYVRETAMDIARERAGDAFPGNGTDGSA